MEYNDDIISICTSLRNPNRWVLIKFLGEHGNGVPATRRDFYLPLDKIILEKGLNPRSYSPQLTALKDKYNMVNNKNNKWYLTDLGKKAYMIIKCFKEI